MDQIFKTKTKTQVTESTMLEIIVIFTLGLFIGNAMTSFLHRIPKNLPISHLNLPMCGLCFEKIPFPRYYALINFAFFKNRCACKKRIKMGLLYTCFEIFIATNLAIMWIYFKYNINFFIAFSGSTSASILAIFSIINEGYLNKKILQLFILFATITNIIIFQNLENSLILFFTGLILDLILSKNKNIINHDKAMFYGITCTFAQNEILFCCWITLFFITNFFHFHNIKTNNTIKPIWMITFVYLIPFITLTI